MSKTRIYKKSPTLTPFESPVEYTLPAWRDAYIRTLAVYGDFYKASLYTNNNTPSKHWQDLIKGTCHESINNSYIKQLSETYEKDILCGFAITINPQGNTLSELTKAFFYSARAVARSLGDIHLRTLVVANEGTGIQPHIHALIECTWNCKGLDIGKLFIESLPISCRVYVQPYYPGGGWVAYLAGQGSKDNTGASITPYVICPIEGCTHKHLRNDKKPCLRDWTNPAYRDMSRYRMEYIPLSYQGTWDGECLQVKVNNHRKYEIKLDVAGNPIKYKSKAQRKTQFAKNAKGLREMSNLGQPEVSIRKEVNAVKRLIRSESGNDLTLPIELRPGVVKRKSSK